MVETVTIPRPMWAQGTVPTIFLCAGFLLSLSESTDQCFAEYLGGPIHRCLDVSLHSSLRSQDLPVNSSHHTLCLMSLTLNLISLNSVPCPENSQGSKLRQPCLPRIPQGSLYFVAYCLMSGKRCFSYCASIFSCLRPNSAISDGSWIPSMVF